MSAGQHHDLTAASLQQLLQIANIFFLMEPLHILYNDDVRAKGIKVRFPGESPLPAEQHAGALPAIEMPDCRSLTVAAGGSEENRSKALLCSASFIFS